MPPLDLKSAAPKAIVFSLDKQIYACPMIRLLIPLQHIGWEIIWAGDIEPSKVVDTINTKDVDLIIIQRHFPSQETEETIRSVLDLEIPVLFDLDDDFLSTPASHPQYDYFASRAPFIKWMLKESDLITVSTKTLKETLAKITRRPITILPNLIDWDLYDTTPQRAIDNFNLIISGTPTHQRDWSIIEKPLIDILQKHKGRVSVTFFGELPSYLLGHPAAKVIPFQPSYLHYVEQLKKLDIHGALVPLENTNFNRGKSNIKWLEYSVAGIAGIYSDLEPYNTSVIHDDTGYLVKNTSESWFAAIDHLVSDPNTAVRIANNARRTIYDNFTIQNQAGLYEAAYNALLGQKHRHNPLSGLQLFRPHLQTRVRRHRAQVTRLFNKHISWRIKQH